MKKSFFYAAIAVAGILLFAVTGVQAASVTFSNIVDGDGLPQFFDVGETSASGNMLTIGLNNFKADGATGPNSALDTLSFTVTAPVGYWITKVTYAEGGDGQTTDGMAIASGSITADGTPKNFNTQFFGPNSNGGWSTTGWVDIDDATEIQVSIFNSLFAAIFEDGETAWVKKTLASVEVEIAPVPIPSTLLLLGGGLAGLFCLRRRVVA